MQRIEEKIILKNKSVETLLEKIKEKEGKIAAMNSVMKAYESTIETFMEKDDLTQYDLVEELKCIRADADRKHCNLLKIEEKFKQLASDFGNNRDDLLKLRITSGELMLKTHENMKKLRNEEKRYDEMKTTASQQLALANSAHETATRENQIELDILRSTLEQQKRLNHSLNDQIRTLTAQNSKLAESVYGAEGIAGDGDGNDPKPSTSTP